MEPLSPNPQFHNDDTVVPFEVMQEKRLDRVAETAQEYLAALSHVSIEGLLQFSANSQKFEGMVDFLQTRTEFQLSGPNVLTSLFTEAYTRATPEQTELLVVIEQLHNLAYQAGDGRYDQYAAQLVFRILQEPTSPSDQPPPPTVA